MENWLFSSLPVAREVKTEIYVVFDDIIQLLIALVTYGEPTPSNYFLHDVDTPNGAFRVIKWLMHSKTRSFLPWLTLLAGVFLLLAKNAQAFLGSDSMDVEYW